MHPQAKLVGIKLGFFYRPGDRDEMFHRGLPDVTPVLFLVASLAEQQEVFIPIAAAIHDANHVVQIKFFCFLATQFARFPTLLHDPLSLAVGRSLFYLPFLGLIATAIPA
jgi:hypothetical protein